LPPLPTPKAMEAKPPKKNCNFQFSLQALLAFIVAASLALAAMRFATTAWADAVASVTIFGLLFSIVLAAYRRPFWIGFAICGIGYFALDQMRFAPDFVDRLITKRSVDSLREMFHPQADFFPPGWVEANLNGQGRSLYFDQSAVSDGNYKWQEMASNFRLIGACLWIWIFATLGGMLARFVAGRSRVQTAPESSHSSGSPPRDRQPGAP
jgi:hypothetical protein